MVEFSVPVGVGGFEKDIDLGFDGGLELGDGSVSFRIAGVDKVKVFFFQNVYTLSEFGDNWDIYSSRHKIVFVICRIRSFFPHNVSLWKCC